jgi:hypothetical protein
LIHRKKHISKMRNKEREREKKNKDKKGEVGGMGI